MQSRIPKPLDIPSPKQEVTKFICSPTTHYLGNWSPGELYSSCSLVLDGKSEKSKPWAEESYYRRLNNNSGHDPDNDNNHDNHNHSHSNISNNKNEISELIVVQR